jgi:hypothetical protein
MFPKEVKPLARGQRFGRLSTVTRVYGSDPKFKRRVFYLFKCDCGNFKTVARDNVKNGHTKSCGCLVIDTSIDAIEKYNKDSGSECHGQSGSSLYNRWQNIKARCYKPSSNRYYAYGARGVVVCDEWRSSFTKFLEWSCANGYEEGLQIDRIDTDGNYEPSNCRWVTPAQNAKNKNSYRGSSKYKGVSWAKHVEKWHSYIRVDGVLLTLGYFNSEEDAGLAYNAAATEHFEEFAKLNKIN